MDNPLNIGVFGGTFDPVHRTHLRIARAARDAAGLDLVLFVVASAPPHKRGGVMAGAEDRLAMVEAAVAGEPSFATSRAEVDRPGPSYTADTLRQLQAEHPGAALHLILGYDSALDLPKWREPEAILAMARLLVFRRPECARPLPPLLADKAVLVPFEADNLSSTEVRRRLARGADTAGLVPPGVLEIIERKGLYHAGGTGRARQRVSGEAAPGSP